MDVFKTKPGINESIYISEETFVKATHKQKPYYQIKNGKERYYAVCPMCDNPIQLVGLYKKNDEGDRKAYGKHHKGSIYKMAGYNEDEYYGCPYSKPNRKKNKIIRKANSMSGNNILKELRNYFDYVIEILTETTDIYISKGAAKIFLENYMTNKGWQYYDSTTENISYMLMYALPAQSLMKRFIKKDSDLYECLMENCPDIKMNRDWNEYVQVENIENKYVSLSFYLCHHKTSVAEEHLFESFTLKVKYNKKEIFSRKIHVNHNRLRQMITEKYRRRYDYLNISKDVFGK